MGLSTEWPFFRLAPCQLRPEDTVGIHEMSQERNLGWVQQSPIVRADFCTLDMAGGTYWG